MIVVSDTSAITSLIQIGRINLLADLFTTVLVPPAVERELRVLHEHRPSFIQVRPVAATATVLRLCREIHLGEAEAIVLAKETSADALLIDEMVGRAVARREGVDIIGLVGVCLTAKRAGLLAEVGPLLDELEQQAQFHMSPELKAQALRSVGE